MRSQLLIILFLSFILQGCFVYKNTVTWKDAKNINDDLNNIDTSDFKLNLSIEKSNRFIVLPFIFLEIHRKKPIYSPVISIKSNNKSITKFSDIQLEFLTQNGTQLFYENFRDTLILNNFKDYNATMNFPKEDILIPSLKEAKDTILVNYSLKTIDVNGVTNEINHSNVKFIRTRYKKFGSFF